MKELTRATDSARSPKPLRTAHIPKPSRRLSAQRFPVSPNRVLLAEVVATPSPVTPLFGYSRPMSLTPATRLGPYEIVAPLGSGGMGEVYRARDSRLGREVAVKVIRAGTLDDAELRRRFRGEAAALSKLSHPNVATVFDVGTHEDTDYLVMELIPGVTLADRLRNGPLPAGELMPLALQLSDGLAAAHECGVVHRDLKPANVRVTPEGRLKVV